MGNGGLTAMKPNTHHNGIICKANTGRNTLLHLKYYRAVAPSVRFGSDTPTLNDTINMRAFNIVPTLKPFEV